MKKREQKVYDKRRERIIVTQQIPMNKFGRVKSLFELFYAPEEIYQVPGSETQID